MSLITMRSLFASHRKMIVDLALFAFAYISPRLFSIILVFAYPNYFNQLGIGRKGLLRKLLCQRFDEATNRNNFSEVWLITVQPHMREKTMLKSFAPKITRAFSMSLEGQAIFTEKNIPFQHISRDWIIVWLMVLGHHSPERLFVVSGLSDVWFMPLKAHMRVSYIAFDSYDPMGEYHNNWRMRALDFLNYRLGKHYIIRDARFKKALRRSSNWGASVCYLPDATQMEIIDHASLVKKFHAVEKIKFVSAGWVTSHGDGGILRSFQHIRKLWPNAEIHLCLTQFMRPADPLFAPLIEYLNKQDGCYVHHNLQGEAYQQILDAAHVGINLHDPNVFGEGYAEFSANMIRRSPSARILDFAARGCVLMTTKEHRYSQHVFKLHSPHKAVIHLSSATRPEELTSLFDNILTCVP